MRICFLAAVLLLARLSASPLPSQQRQANIDSFEKIWTAVRDENWDPKLEGVDWNGAHDELLPAVKNAATQAEARDVMTKLLARLKRTHYNILPSDVYSRVEELKAAEGAGEGDPGMQGTALAGAVVVSRVRAGSPAARAGIHTGWIIVTIGGQPLAEVVTALKGSKLPQSELMISELIRAKLQSPAGAKTPYEFIDETGKRIALDLVNEEPQGQLAPGIGYLPPMRFSFETKRIAPQTGYIAFNLFIDPATMMKQFEDAVVSCLKCKGLIIDLRGNHGGIGGMAMGMAGWLIDKPGQHLGTMIMRNTQLQFVVNPRPSVYTGPLAILVDGASASTAEIFAGGLQDLKRARIFGTITAAAALPSVIIRLPNGDGFQYAVANYISEGGKQLEGSGVTPDTIVSQSREALLRQHDLVIDAALNWIQNQ